ncbi:unnamed protein product, partial [Gongylonema pulchrum]|uniref:Ig-like domain-containing protein n=1 Tax=Gongylonema pulchrum TaxID=637853 RepID=A0A183EI99_9BILA
FVNVNRLQTGVDNFGGGRYPYYIEPVVIISITDGNCLTCPQYGTVNEVVLERWLSCRASEIQFRWRGNHLLYDSFIRFDDKPIVAIKMTPGSRRGRSYCITSHKMLSSCIESIIQKLQQQGIVLHFEKIGPDPPPIPDRANGLVENCKKNGELNVEKLSGVENWRSITCSVYSRASRSYPGHWPIPEAFWPDRNINSSE